MGHIFISYSRRDKKQIDRLVVTLEKAGHNVWLDREDIKGGDQWRTSIVQGIKKGHALVVAISPHSVASDNVRKELDVAEGASVRIIPIKLKDIDIPDEMEYQLAGTQHIDLSGNHKAGVKQLLSVIGEDKKATPPWYRRGLAKLVLWVVGGALLGLTASFFVRGGGTDYSLLGTIIGAVLGLAAGIGIFKLFGWAVKVILWTSAVIVGAIAGGLAWTLVGPLIGASSTGSDEVEIVFLLGGALLGVVGALLVKRWRRSRKQARLAALAA